SAFGSSSRLAAAAPKLSASARISSNRSIARCCWSNRATGYSSGSQYQRCPSWSTRASRSCPVVSSAEPGDDGEFPGWEAPGEADPPGGSDGCPLPACGLGKKTQPASVAPSVAAAIQPT